MGRVGFRDLRAAVARWRREAMSIKGDCVITVCFCCVEDRTVHQQLLVLIRTLETKPDESNPKV